LHFHYLADPQMDGVYVIHALFFFCYINNYANVNTWSQLAYELRMMRHECKLFKVEYRKDEAQERKKKRKQQAEEERRRREFSDDEDYYEDESSGW